MLAIAHDHQLRALLKAHLGAHLGEGDLLVDEFSLAYGAVRADLALVNGHLEGFEIKAGKDTLARLPAQVEAYGRVFEYSWIVTTTSHLGEVRSVVPKSWGLLVAHSDGDGCALMRVRKAQRNTKRDATHIVRLLWRDEVMTKLAALGMSRGLKSKPKIELFAALAQAMSVGDLTDYVRQCLKSRPDWRLGAAPRECGDLSRPDAI
jgi:hypothetical protein